MVSYSLKASCPEEDVFLLCSRRSCNQLVMQYKIYMDCSIVAIMSKDQFIFLVKQND